MTLAALLLGAALSVQAAPIARDAATNDPGSVHALMDGSLQRARQELGGKVHFMGAEGYFPGSSRSGPSEIWRLGWERPGNARDDYRGFKCEEHLNGVLFTPDMKKLEVRAQCTIRTCTAIDANFIDAPGLSKKLRGHGVRPNSQGQYWALLIGRNCQSRTFTDGGILRGAKLPAKAFDKLIWAVNNYTEVVLLDAENGALVHRYPSSSQ